MSKSRSLNKVMLIGNLTRSPILKETNNGVVVCSFGIATNTSWKDRDGGTQEKTEYHNLIAFNKLAEICATVLDTGMLVYVEGELRTRAIDGQDGKKYYRTEIKLNDMSLLDSKGKKGVGVDSATSISEDHDDIEGVSNEPLASEDETSEFKSEDLF
jgi:single-strand DNA-binding protein